MSARIAILGTGWGAGTQIPAFRAAGLEIVALWGRTPEKARRAAEEAGVPFASADFAEILERSDVDLVSVATPPSSHAELSVRALEAGKHVLCEKPTAMDASEAARMLEAARARPELLALIDHELRFIPGRRRLRELVLAGYAGRVLHVEATHRSGFRLGAHFPWNWWSERRHGGGILGALGSHLIDALTWTLGRRVEAVSARLSTFFPRRAGADGRERAADADEYAALELEFAGGIAGTVYLSTGVAGAEPDRILVAGTEASLTYEDGRLVGRRPSGKTEDLTRAEDLEALAGLRQDEWGRGSFYLGRALGQALADGDRGEVSIAAGFEDGLRIQEVLDAARGSDAERRWMDVGAV